MTDIVVTGTSTEIHLGFAFSPSKPPHTYLGVAWAMLEGVNTLAASENPPPAPLALIAAHALECTLKAYLSRNGDDSHVKKKDIQHNLLELWSCANNDGLSITSDPPEWVRMLSNVHKRPYTLRYSEGVHGLVLPAPYPMTTELSALVSKVSRQLGSPPCS